jgi:hypothetical protein
VFHLITENNVDLKKIVKHFEYKGLTEIYETIGEWRFEIPALPISLKIKVVKLMFGHYKGIANYTIQNPEQTNPHLSMELGNTVEEAISNTLNGFLQYWNNEKYRYNTELKRITDW